jgi:exodeoxyribonuclease V gamma subunit
LPKVPETTWRFGLDRLLLGYAMPGLAEAPATETAGTTPLVPCLEVEGEGALVMGRFVDFVERVFQGLKGLEEKRSLADWSKKLLELLDQVFDLEQDADGVGQVRDALEALAAEGLAVPGEELVAFAAVREALRSELEESGGSPEVFRGGVSVCGMRLMRGVPFRVVCVLGMNDGAFPRRNQRPGFDLLTGDVRAGDPSPRHDDRYLFLQLLQSARERFYLSYLGQSDRDNAELPPSVLVSELLDYAEARFLPADGATKVAKWLTVRHPLHRFSPTYFGAPANGKPGAAANRPGSLFSYSTESYAAARQLAAGGGSPWVFANETLPEPGAEFRTLRVADLVAFLKNPSRYFLEQRLKLKLREKDRHELAEDELFGLNDLQRYSLENELLGKLMKAPQTADAAERIRPRWVAECRLPLGEPGRAEHGSVATYAGWLGEGLMAQGVQATESLTVNLTIGEFRLKGSVPVNATGGVLHWRAGKLREVDRLETWVEHLVALTMNKGGASRLIGEAQTANKETKLPLLQVRTYAQADDARTVLQELLDLYWRGLASPLPFFPKSAMAYAEKMADPEADEETQEEAQKAARGKWEGNPHAKGENVDIHFESCFRGLENPLDDKFENVGMEIYKPLLRHEAAPENLP